MSTAGQAGQEGSGSGIKELNSIAIYSFGDHRVSLQSRHSKVGDLFHRLGQCRRSHEKDSLLRGHLPRRRGRQHRWAVQLPGKRSTRISYRNHRVYGLSRMRNFRHSRLASLFLDPEQVTRQEVCGRRREIRPECPGV